MKYGLKVLGILIALVIVASSVAMYGYSGTEGGEGISEGGGGKGVVSLVAPPFIGVAGAAEAAGGNAFPEDEAGISAYVNVNQSINITEAVKAFTQIEELSQTHAIGIIPIDNKRGTTNVHVYVDTDGYIVAYFKNTEPASNIIKWSGMDFDNPKIVDFTTNAAIKAMCDKINVYYRDIKDDIKYYDFEFPDAEKMVIFLNARSSDGDEYTHIFIPGKYRLYEASYSLIGEYYSGYGWGANLYVDGTEIDHTDYLTTGLYDLESTLTLGEPHTINLYTHKWGGVGTILIYKEG